MEINRKNSQKGIIRLGETTAINHNKPRRKAAQDLVLQKNRIKNMTESMLRRLLFETRFLLELLCCTYSFEPYDESHLHHQARRT